MGNIRVESFSEPSLPFAEIAQHIGLEAWRDQFPERSETEIRHMFDPDNHQKAQSLFDYMEQRASRGHFIGVMAFHDNTEMATEDIIGFAWAANGVFDGWLGQAKKIYRKKPHAWLAQLNVIPEMQGQGIGSQLARTAFASFNEDQKPTAYVCTECPKTMRWFTTQGFDFVGRPEKRTTYFGEKSAPVRQQRLQGYDISCVLDRLLVPRHGRLR